MAKKILIAAALAFCLLFTACAGGGAEQSGSGGENKLVITDSAGDPLAEYITGKEPVSEKGYSSYVGTAVAEASETIISLGLCEREEIVSELLSGGYVIETAFDRDIAAALKSAADGNITAGIGFGCAVTDLQGRLVAAYDGVKEYAFLHNAPYSSFKPLAVYAPAIERGLAVWSSAFSDSPYKQVEREDGSLSDWPANADGKYSNKDVALPAAIARSLNTVAVRCMKRVGVLNSLDFLRDSFGRNFDSERTRAEIYGEEEVIGNCALGYLYDGVSPAEMAGFYQIFANGGTYFAPKTVMRITKNGKEIYKYSPEGKRVIKESTAYIMNRLLCGVVMPGGTGAAARLDAVEVGGKTGSGDDGYWFVGFTPDYTCAVWHDITLGYSLSPAVFAAAVSGFPASGKSYPECPDVQKMVYCTDTGLLSFGGCPHTDAGYFDKDNLPEYCNAH